MAHSEAAPTMTSIRRAEIGLCRFCSQTLYLLVDDLRPRWLHATSGEVECPRRTAPRYS